MIKVRLKSLPYVSKAGVELPAFMVAEFPADEAHDEAHARP